MNQVITLKSGSKMLTTQKNNAYTILNGTVRVYMVTVSEDKIGRRALLATVGESHSIPGFLYTDMDHKTYQFLIVAATDAELITIEDGATKPLKKSFSKACDIGNYDKEGYEEGFIDKYKMILAREDAFFIKTSQEKNEVIRRTDELVESVFAKNESKRDTLFNEKSSRNVLYDTLEALCKKTNIPIISYEKLTECVGENISIKAIAKYSHFSIREVILEEDWYKRDLGVLFSFMEDGRPIALVPRSQQGYDYILDGKYNKKLRKSVAGQIVPKAYMIYRPLPSGAMNWADLIKYTVKSINKLDFISMTVLALAITAIGLITPTVTQLVYDEYIPKGDKEGIVFAGVIVCAFMISSLLFTVVKYLNKVRLGSHIRYDLQNAILQRVFEYPADFFRKFDSTDLNRRVMTFGINIESAIVIIPSLVYLAINTVVFSVQMMSYSVTLSFIGLSGIIIICILNYLISKACMKHELIVGQYNHEADKKLFELIGGIDKIRMAGVEDRAVYEYLKPLTNKRLAEIRRSKINNIQTILTAIIDALIPTLSYIFLYSGNSELSQGNYVAFITVFGFVVTSLMGIGEYTAQILMLKPKLKKLEPILNQESENSESKIMPGELSGEIGIEHVTFNYGENEDDVISDLSLHIDAGEYIGIVGASGCGKSTLVKLLLGFENPTAGKIYYGDNSIDAIDFQQLRKQLGVVLQDGQLIAGTIHENVTVTKPNATVKEVERALKIVNLDRDIDKMPMGLHTILSENNETISGGQKQRILIARAIINNPRILIMDEATSALDNQTQQQICDALSEMDCTRIVIAHRLSTIKNCDRIIVMDKGSIAEEGDFDSLYEKGGLFYKLVNRQIL